MAIVNTRHQLPVGQGFFHVGWIQPVKAEEGFFYVYDCGAMAEYTSARNREIGKLVAHIGRRARLDFLVISHMDADHVNGVEKLVTDGAFNVDTVMMPLVDMKERLLAFASVAHHDPESARSSFYREFIVDPVSAVSRFGPRIILQVRRGGSGSPGSGSLDDGLPDDEPPAFGEGRGYEWRLVGQGTARDRSSEADAPRVVEIPDSFAATVFEPGMQEEAWLLAPYVDRGTVTKTNLFLATLAKERKTTKQDLKANMLDSEFVRNLLTDHVGALRTAYRACCGNLNLTSLCLYSGPVGEVGAVHECEVAHGPWRCSTLHDGRVAWLATGDAKLKSVAKCDAFIAHFKDHLEKVSTFTLPHHGAAGDFNKKLLASVKPNFCLVSADAIKKWQHPAALVTRAVASASAVLLVSNADQNTTIRETVLNIASKGAVRMSSRLRGGA